MGGPLPPWLLLAQENGLKKAAPRRPYPRKFPG